MTASQNSMSRWERRNSTIGSYRLKLTSSDINFLAIPAVYMGTEQVPRPLMLQHQQGSLSNVISRHGIWAHRKLPSHGRCMKSKYIQELVLQCNWFQTTGQSNGDRWGWKISSGTWEVSDTTCLHQFLPHYSKFGLTLHWQSQWNTGYSAQHWDACRTESVATTIECSSHLL